MIAHELIQHYAFFTGLATEQIDILISVAKEIKATTGHIFFTEGDECNHLFLVVEGAIAISIIAPDRSKPRQFKDDNQNNSQSNDIIISTAGTGTVFGWSGLVPPHKATASAKALTPCRVISFNCTKLLDIFGEDHSFGYLMSQKIIQVLRDRLRDMRMESLFF